MAVSIRLLLFYPLLFCFFSSFFLSSVSHSSGLHQVFPTGRLRQVAAAGSVWLVVMEHHLLHDMHGQVCPTSFAGHVLPFSPGLYIVCVYI